MPVILLYPLLLVVAGVVAWRRRATTAGAVGWRWFGAWLAAGALVSFSYLSAFSIGLLVLPPAAFVLLWTARRAPDAREALGFAAGVGIVFGLLAPFVGAVVTGVSLVGYWALRGRDGVTTTP